MQRPVHFIAFDESTNKFQVTAEAIALLRGIEGPIAVLSVSGKARQGKSYLLNQLLGQRGAFQVAPTQRPCTKGLWLWSKPIPRTAQPTNFHIVLLDTEGINAFDQTGRFSTQIFCLAMLLSSLFVFNQMGPIDESAIKELALACEVIKRVRSKAEEGAAGQEQLENFTPTFLWLLRDFYLKLSDEHGEVTPNEYLEAALSHVKGTGPDVEAKNEIRNSVKELFPDRSCYVLVRPVTDESALTRLDSLSEHALRPEFRDGILNLINTVNSKARPKKLGDVMVTGSMLAGLAQAYVAAINEGAVPTISSAWMSVAMTETAQAAENAEKCYDEDFDKGVQPDEHILSSEHQRCVALALMVFEKEAMGNDSVKGPQRERLLFNLHRRFDLFKQKVLAEASARVDSFLMNMANDLVQNAPRMNVDELFQAATTGLKKLEKEAPGAIKWEKMYQFVVCNLGTALVQKAMQATEETKKLHEAHQELLTKLQQSAASEAEHKDLERKHRELQECHNGLIRESVKDKNELEQLKGRAQSFQEERVRIESAQLKDTREHLQNVTNERDHLKAKLEEAFQTNKHLQEALDMAVKEADVAKRKQNGEASGMKQEWDQARMEWQRERRATDAVLNEERYKLEALKHELMEARRENAELKKRISYRESLAGEGPRDASQSRFAQDEAARQSQLNDAHEAIRTAEERIRVMQASINGQEPVWNSPGRDAFLSHSSSLTNARSTVSPKLSEEEIEKMTVAQLKEWLMRNNCEEMVWNTLQQGIPRKADWVKMVKERMK